MLIAFTASIPSSSMADLLTTIMESQYTFANDREGWFTASLDSMQEWKQNVDYPKGNWFPFSRNPQANLPWYSDPVLWDDEFRAVISVEYTNAMGLKESRSLSRQDFVNAFTTLFATHPVAFCRLSQGGILSVDALIYWNHVLFGKVVHS